MALLLRYAPHVMKRVRLIGSDIEVVLDFNQYDKMGLLGGKRLRNRRVKGEAKRNNLNDLWL